MVKKCLEDSGREEGCLRQNSGHVQQDRIAYMRDLVVAYLTNYSGCLQYVGIESMRVGRVIISSEWMDAKLYLGLEWDWDSDLRTSTMWPNHHHDICNHVKWWYDRKIWMIWSTSEDKLTNRLLAPKDIESDIIPFTYFFLTVWPPHAVLNAVRTWA